LKSSSFTLQSLPTISSARILRSATARQNVEALPDPISEDISQDLNSDFTDIDNRDNEEESHSQHYLRIPVRQKLQTMLQIL
jgi:hypothetical protein